MDHIALTDDKDGTICRFKRGKATQGRWRAFTSLVRVSTIEPEGLGPDHVEYFKHHRDGAAARQAAYVDTDPEFFRFADGNGRELFKAHRTNVEAVLDKLHSAGLERVSLGLLRRAIDR